MRSHILRDVVAGCAGVLAVVAVIGLPGNSSRTSSVSTNPTRCVRLLPVYFKGPARMPMMCAQQPVHQPVIP